MVDQIRALTSEALRASARAAAEQGVSHDEANHFEHGSVLWRAFREAYHGVVETA